MVLAQYGNRALPRLFRCAVDVAEVLGIREGGSLPLQAPGDDLLPSGEMDDEFPNAMGIVDGTRERGFRLDTLEDFPECRTVPRFAFEGTVELINDERDFGHGFNLALSNQHSAFSRDGSESSHNWNQMRDAAFPG